MGRRRLQRTAQTTVARPPEWRWWQAEARIDGLCVLCVGGSPPIVLKPPAERGHHGAVLVHNYHTTERPVDRAKGGIGQQQHFRPKGQQPTQRSVQYGEALPRTRHMPESKSTAGGA